MVVLIHGERSPHSKEGLETRLEDEGAPQTAGVGSVVVVVTVVVRYSVFVASTVEVVDTDVVVVICTTETMVAVLVLTV